MWFIAVDDLFREANVEPNGKVKYDEFIRKITIPARDYTEWRESKTASPGTENSDMNF